MTTFGEISEPSTRTAWEDWDDYSNVYNSLSWRVDIDIPQNIDTFLLVDGKYIVDYILKRTNLQLESYDSIPEANLTVYRNKEDNNYICFVKDYDLLQSSEVTEMLRDFIVGSKNVLILQSKPLSEYQVTHNSLEDCVIRNISTSKSEKNAGYPRLEQPNIMSGVSAGALILREHLGLTGTAYLCYIECTEDYDIEKLQILLKKIGIKQNKKPVSNINTNLYI